MLDLGKLTSYSIEQVNGELALLSKKQKALKRYAILLCTLTVILLVTCIILSVFTFRQVNTNTMHLLMVLSIVSFILFLISFGITTFLFIISIPSNKNKIDILNRFINKK